MIQDHHIIPAQAGEPWTVPDHSSRLSAGPCGQRGRELGGQGGTATWKGLMGTSWLGWGSGSVGCREGGARWARGHSGRATDSSGLGVAAGGPHLPDCCSPDASTAGQAHPTR